jgi:hypothetical protein
MSAIEQFVYGALVMALAPWPDHMGGTVQIETEVDEQRGVTGLFITVTGSTVRITVRETG